MPPPSSQKHDIEPPEEITTEALWGFLAGAFQFGSVSILAHMIMKLPHPFKFSPDATPPTLSQSQSSSPSSPPKSKLSYFSKAYLRSRFFYRPLEGFSDWLSPASRVYRGLTPQFKVFLQIAAMTLGGCIWAERRVNDYIDLIRRTKRAERLQAQRAARYMD
ncbi:hypothetical protein FE257_001844 [Aspergillus nanangensis]|uniref:Uncharacterized protein n=1 Tax=Aspergillus nanangensis TaxID=2582783 RepID=A0AAD4CDB6_ASPNN|nr:hypothetical protein FE257_001844 [Aspergillus nanangensis]